jgi:hypothetical protein
MRRGVFREGKGLEKFSPERHEVVKWSNDLAMEGRERIHGGKEASEASKGEGRMKREAIPNRVIVPKWKGKRL